MDTKMGEASPGRRAERLVRVIVKPQRTLVGSSLQADGVGFVVKAARRMRLALMLKKAALLGERLGSVVVVAMQTSNQRRQPEVGPLVAVMGAPLGQGLEVALEMSQTALNSVWKKEVAPTV